MERISLEFIEVADFGYLKWHKKKLNIEKNQKKIRKLQKIRVERVNVPGDISLEFLEVLYFGHLF